jgi:hypothetical protein
MTTVDGRCPTFSWSRSPEARSYELVVLEVDRADGTPLEPPVTRVDLPAGATTWVAADGDCLEPGRRYAWAIRTFTADGESSVSQASLFEVRSAPSRAELREALELLARHLRAEEASDAEGADDSQPRGRATSPRRQVPAGPGSPGRAVANTPAITSTPASFSSSGIDRASAVPETFDIRNSGA